MRSFFVFAALFSAATVLASPIDLNRAEELRARGISENEILRQLGARHPTPSLGKLDLDFINVAGHEKRDAFPEAEAMPEAEPKAHKNEHMKAAILAVIRKTLSHARRGLEWAGVARSADAEANAYEGMESLVRRPEYQVRLRM